MTEFALIAKYFQNITDARYDVALGVGDDCALLQAPANHLLAVTTDTLVAGVHFFPDTEPFSIGYKALAVNLSDLAAMGAEPAWLSLAITLPSSDEQWLSEFCLGFGKLARQYNMQLVGGDTTQGPLSITVTAYGFVPKQQALRRDAAQPGDKIYVTGTLGDAGAGLKILQGTLQVKSTHSDKLITRLHNPTPRILEGLALRSIANAAIDVSDGLAADLNHILESSSVGARLWVDQLPISDELAQNMERASAWNLALTAGDDYELCFTVLPAKEARLKELNLACCCVGEIEAQPGLRLQLTDGKPYDLPNRRGYQHFGETL